MPLAALSIPPGVVKPATPLQAKSRWWDANLVRWRAGKLLPVGGWQRIVEAPLNPKIRTIVAWTGLSGISFAALAADTELFLLEGATYKNITPDGYAPPDISADAGYGAFDYGALLYGDDTSTLYPRPPGVAFAPAFSWTLDNWGEELLAVASSDGRLLKYAAGAVRAVPVAGPAAGNRAMVVTPERHAVMIGYGGNPRRVAWSSRENYTDWNFSSVTNTAGYLDLETQTRLSMLAPVREGTLIWTDDEVWLMRFIGLPYIYSVERIGFGCGLLAPRAFTTTAGRCIWMGKESFWLYDGGVVRPLPCDVGSFVFDNIDPNAGALYSHGSENNLFPEAWFWYPSAGSNVPNRYVFYNYSENFWGVGEMPRTAATGAGVFQWPLAAAPNGDVYFQENGWTDAGLPLETARFAETGSLNIQSGSAVSYVRQVITDSGYAYDSTELTFYSTFTPEGVQTTSGPFSPRADGYTDVRVSGRDFRVKVSATQDAPWSVGEMRLDFVPRGGR